jgi:hypothetical protein
VDLINHSSVCFTLSYHLLALLYTLLLPLFTLFSQELFQALFVLGKRRQALFWKLTSGVWLEARLTLTVIYGRELLLWSMYFNWLIHDVSIRLPRAVIFGRFKMSSDTYIRMRWAVIASRKLSSLKLYIRFISFLHRRSNITLSLIENVLCPKAGGFSIQIRPGSFTHTRAIWGIKRLLVVPFKDRVSCLTILGSLLDHSRILIALSDDLFVLLTFFLLHFPKYSGFIILLGIQNILLKVLFVLLVHKLITYCERMSLFNLFQLLFINV